MTVPKFPVVSLLYSISFSSITYFNIFPLYVKQLSEHIDLQSTTENLVNAFVNMNSGALGVTNKSAVHTFDQSL